MKRRTLGWVLGVGVAALGVVLAIAVTLEVAPIVVSAANFFFPRDGHAARSAQETADRIAPGMVRVVGADSSGEAGGYAIQGVLVDDPEAALGWHSDVDGRCDRLDACEVVIPSSIHQARSRVAEIRAVQRAFAACGAVSTRPGDTAHQEISGPGLPGRIEDQVTVTLAADELADVRATGERLDACARTLPGQRAALPPQSRLRITLTLKDPVGGPFADALIYLVDGQVRVSSAATLQPPFDPAHDRIVEAAVVPVVRDWLGRGGASPTDPLGVDEFATRFLPGRTDRVRVYLPFVDRARGVVTGAVAVTVDRDGSRPSDISRIAWNDGPDDPALPPAPPCRPGDGRACPD